MGKAKLTKEVKAERIGLDFEEISDFLSEETLDSMTMSHILGGDTVNNCNGGNCADNCGVQCSGTACGSSNSGTEVNPDITVQVALICVENGICRNGSGSGSGN